MPNLNDIHTLRGRADLRRPTHTTHPRGMKEEDGEEGVRRRRDEKDKKEKNESEGSKEAQDRLSGTLPNLLYPNADMLRPPFRLVVKIILAVLGMPQPGRVMRSDGWGSNRASIGPICDQKSTNEHQVDAMWSSTRAQLESTTCPAIFLQTRRSAVGPPRG